MLREDGWHHLDLPAIAENDEDIPIGPGVVYRRRPGEALHPQREPIAVLEDVRRQMGSRNFSAQYLQRPVPLEGNLVKRAWIEWYDSLPTARRRAGRAELGHREHYRRIPRLVGLHHVADRQAALLSPRRLAWAS